MNKLKELLDHDRENREMIKYQVELLQRNNDLEQEDAEALFSEIDDAESDTELLEILLRIL